MVIAEQLENQAASEGAAQVLIYSEVGDMVAGVTLHHHIRRRAGNALRPAAFCWVHSSLSLLLFIHIGNIQTGAALRGGVFQLDFGFPIGP